MARATIKDVAAAAGVALGTASRALTGKGSIAPETRDRVLAAAQELDYIPHGQASALRSASTHTIGLLVPDVRNPFFAEMAHIVEGRARAAGFSVVLCSANEDSELMRHYTRVLMRQRVDGIIVAPFSTARDSIAALQAAGIPLVFIDRTIPDLGVPAVVSDTRAAIQEAVTWLATDGARTIGFISGPDETSTGRERMAEFVAAAEAASLPTRIHRGDFLEASGRHGMSSLLDAGVDAVLTADSRMTFGAAQEALARGLSPARDLRFVGFDDISPFALLHPALPLICQDIESLGTSAVQLLVDQLSGHESSAEIRVPAQLRIPQSISGRSVAPDTTAEVTTDVR